MGGADCNSGPFYSRHGRHDYFCMVGSCQTKEIKQVKHSGCQRENEKKSKLEFEQCLAICHVQSFFLPCFV
jgi:hypothetical protein